MAVRQLDAAVLSVVRRVRMRVRLYLFMLLTAAAAAANCVARFDSRQRQMRRFRASPGGFENALSCRGTKCELSLN